MGYFQAVGQGGYCEGLEQFDNRSGMGESYSSFYQGEDHCPELVYTFINVRAAKCTFVSDLIPDKTEVFQFVVWSNLVVVEFDLGV